MKKLIFALCFAVAGIVAVNAQNNAIGLRLGWGAEVSYQRSFSDLNRLELDLGLDNWLLSGIQLSGIYQWKWGIGSSDFSWYVGPGVGVGFYWYIPGVSVMALGNIGVEYNFPSIPLQLAIDYRPGIGVGFGGGIWPCWSAYSGGLAVRYTF